MSTAPRVIVIALIMLTAVRAPAQRPAEYFTIHLVDGQTGRGVPLAELRTVNHLRFVSDSNGLIAFHEPGLMGTQVFFYVFSHGYEFPKDGFGYRGISVDVVPGGSTTIKLKRINIAERLYRVTGGGIYRDSRLLGRDVPISKPPLAAKVLGSDSIVSAVYRDQVYWFWGDTNRPSYPLGNFHVPGATTSVLEPNKPNLERGVDLKYFLDETGFAKETCRMPGEGPTWIDGLTVVDDESGNELMFAKYVKVKKPMVVYERGLVQWNDEKQQFDRLQQFDMDWPVYPQGHPVHVNLGHREFVYFCDAIPSVRVLATAQAVQNVGQYEAFTCLKSGSRETEYELDRDLRGRVRYRWRKNAPPLSPKLLADLVQSGEMKREESFYQLRDMETLKPIMLHRSSVYWNQFRKRWVLIGLEAFGTSMLGEIWFAEADTPLGPWVYAAKVVTHDDYSFYNPKQHPMFSRSSDRYIFFEGTYTTTFSGNTDPTPRYDYNQVMYRLDLADERLNLPVPAYRIIRDGRAAGVATSTQLDDTMTPLEIAFFVLPIPSDGCIALAQEEMRKLTTRQHTSADDNVLGFALPADWPEAPAGTGLLYEYVNLRTGERLYGFNGDVEGRQWLKVPEPVCRAWHNPLPGPLPYDVLANQPIVGDRGQRID